MTYKEVAVNVTVYIAVDQIDNLSELNKVGMTEEAAVEAINKYMADKTREQVRRNVAPVVAKEIEAEGVRVSRVRY